MSEQDEMERMANEVLVETGLRLLVTRVVAPQQQAHTWCISFSDPKRISGRGTFDVTVSWRLGSTYMTVKQDLKQQLQARVKPQV